MVTPLLRLLSLPFRIVWAVVYFILQIPFAIANVLFFVTSRVFGLIFTLALKWPLKTFWYLRVVTIPVLLITIAYGWIVENKPELAKRIGLKSLRLESSAASEESTKKDE